ncbi:brain acid soluble protein 1-like [Dermacentor albipictus]|uniref:brain acid soluble protein 1-like n=1 Tax=Dermacentor albipictus TaxID=60249 RepID=UPI0038FCE213
MTSWDDGTFHNFLSFALFTICVALVAVLVWVLLRRLRRDRQMRDQETMTVEPCAKPGSMADSVSGTGASHKESVLQVPGADAHDTTKGNQGPSVGEGPRLADSQAPTTTAAPETNLSSPPGGSERSPEAKPESKEQSAAPCASSPGDSRQTSVLTGKSKKRRHSESKKSPETGKAEKEDGKGGRSGAASKTGSKPSSRRGSVPPSQASASGEAVEDKSASVPAVAALLIRRPSSSSKSSQRSNRSTRYVRETPKVPPPLDIFSREHSSMAESPQSNPSQSPPQAAAAATEPAKPPEAPEASSKAEAPEKPPTEATTEGH